MIFSYLHDQLLESNNGKPPIIDFNIIETEKGYKEIMNLVNL